MKQRKGSYLMSIEFKFGKVEKFWRLVSQQCESSSHHRSVHLKMVKMVSFMMCVLFNHNKKCKTQGGGEVRDEWNRSLELADTN